MRRAKKGPAGPRLPRALVVPLGELHGLLVGVGNRQQLQYCGKRSDELVDYSYLNYLGD